MHALVRSTASSPLSYNAFDPWLQLWVAACLYRYYVDQHEFLYGPLDDDCRRRGVSGRQEAGHHTASPRRHVATDRVAFDEFWKRSLDDLRIDPPVREHLRGVAAMAFLPAPLRLLAGPLQPVRHRPDSCPPSSARRCGCRGPRGQQRKFEWLLTALRIADRVIPRDVWHSRLRASTCATCGPARAAAGESSDPPAVAAPSSAFVKGPIRVCRRHAGDVRAFTAMPIVIRIVAFVLCRVDDRR